MNGVSCQSDTCCSRRCRICMDCILRL
jgi:hypothetical protein